MPDPDLTVKRCPIPYCSYAIADDAHDSQTIEHLLNTHGWPALLEILRDGCMFDCDVCRSDEGES